MGRKKKLSVKTYVITAVTLTLLAISLFPYYYGASVLYLLGSG